MNKTNDDKHHTDETEECLNEFQGRFEKRMRDPKFALEVAGFIVLCVYAFFTILLYCANKNAADAAKASADAAVAQTRPIIWLVSDFGHPNYLPSPSEQITWELRFKNYGKTPAGELVFAEIYLKTGIDGQWMPTYIGKDVKPEKIAHPVAPDEEIRIDGVTAPGISQNRFDQLLGISKAISIKGTISYTDTSKVFYETKFCLTRLNLGGITFCDENYIH